MRPATLALTVVALMAVLLPAGAQASAPIFQNIKTNMDTPEPPDGHFTTNTTGCVWNDEDQVEYLWTGSLAAGQAAAVSTCLVADLDGHAGSAYPKLLLGRVYASKPTLQVWLTNEQGQRWDSRPAISAGNNRIVYQFCVPDAVADNANIYSWRNLTYWPIVPGTTGYGQIVNYTMHVQATTSTHKISAYFSAAFNGGVIPNIGPVIQFLPPSEVPCPVQG